MRNSNAARDYCKTGLSAWPEVRGWSCRGWHRYTAVPLESEQLAGKGKFKYMFLKVNL
jgi:hypothetical protein